MIKVQNGVATREPIPDFLLGLAAADLADLSWTDPALGVSDLAWWPEESADKPLPTGKKYGDETLTPVKSRKVVKVSHAIIDMSADEINLQNSYLAEGFVAAAQQAMDSQARALGYDSAATAVTYAEEPAVPRFQEEGRAIRAWRSKVWAFAYDLLDKVKAGSVAVPTVDEFLSQMPVYVAGE